MLGLIKVCLTSGPLICSFSFLCLGHSRSWFHFIQQVSSNDPFSAHGTNNALVPPCYLCVLLPLACLCLSLPLRLSLQPPPQHASLKAGTSSFLFTSASTRSSLSVTQWLLMFVEWMMIFLVALFSHESYAPSAVE